MYIGEIEYINSEGDAVHSDLCCDFNSKEYRELLHECLDEWLNNSDGSGIFYVKGVSK